jgi:ABC-2 type transport system ATP-binding protein
VADDPELAAATIRSQLHNRGYRVAGVDEIVPSLEDVFVSLIEAKDRAEEPPKEVKG